MKYRVLPTGYIHRASFFLHSDVSNTGDLQIGFPLVRELKRVHLAYGFCKQVNS